MGWQTNVRKGRGRPLALTRLASLVRAGDSGGSSRHGHPGRSHLLTRVPRPRYRADADEGL